MTKINQIFFSVYRFGTSQIPNMGKTCNNNVIIKISKSNYQGMYKNKTFINFSYGYFLYRIHITNAHPHKY